MSVHLHTSDPAAFRAVMEEFGTVETFRVDDLVEQQAAGLAPPIALVVDSTCDLSEAAQLRLGTVMVPLTMTVAGQRVPRPRGVGSRGVLSTSSERARSYPARRSPAASTSVGRVRGPVGGARGGGLRASLLPALRHLPGSFTAAKDVDEDRIKVIDSCHVSVGMGLVVEAAGEAIRAGEGLDRVVAIAEAAAADTRVYGATPSLEFAVKGGRVSGRSARVADFLRLKPDHPFRRRGRRPRRRHPRRFRTRPARAGRQKRQVRGRRARPVGRDTRGCAGGGRVRPQTAAPAFRRR